MSHSVYSILLEQPDWTKTYMDSKFCLLWCKQLTFCVTNVCFHVENFPSFKCKIYLKNSFSLPHPRAHSYFIHDAESYTGIKHLGECWESAW